MGRLTRAESQARTRQDLIAAATVIFARRGFNAASIEEVADEARYTKGAVYSNFKSKDELFLAVLETRLRERAKFYGDLAEQARAQPGQDLAGLLPRLDEPNEVWCLLELEFWLYALRNPTARTRMAALHRQYRDQLTPLGAPYASVDIKPVEVVAAAIALYHGLTLQRQSDPRSIRPDLVSRILRALNRTAAARSDHPPVPRGGRKRTRKRSPL